MINIVIKETGERCALSIMDPAMGVDYIKDFIGNYGAFLDGQFTLDEKRDTYMCSQATFDWWRQIVEENQALAIRIYALLKYLGSDAVHAAICDAGIDVDLENNAAAVNAALDEEFGDD